MADDVIAMSLTCAGCGQSIFNDKPEIRHPIDFIAACEARGWSAPHQPRPVPPTCPTCLSKRNNG